MYEGSNPWWVETIVTVFVTMLASSGFWALIQSKLSKNDAQGKLLAGLAHDRIIHVGKAYIKRGWITPEEYDDFMTYLYDPYRLYGGNGVAKRISDEVRQLPIRSWKRESIE